MLVSSIQLSQDRATAEVNTVLLVYKRLDRGQVKNKQKNNLQHMS